MRKKYILLILLSLTVIYIIFRIGRIVYYSHNTEHNPKTYLWLFDDSIKADLDTFVSIGHVRRSDKYYHYLYKERFAVSIFEYSELGFIDLKKIRFYSNCNLDDFSNSFSGEIYNTNLYPLPETLINFELPFNNSFCVNLDSLSTIDKRIINKNYQGFFGHIHKMSLSNSEQKQLVLFDYRSYSTPTLFLIYKYHAKFLVILINSEDSFDEKIINILDLK